MRQRLHPPGARSSPTGAPVTEEPVFCSLCGKDVARVAGETSALRNEKSRRAFDLHWASVHAPRGRRVRLRLQHVRAPARVFAFILAAIAGVAVGALAPPSGFVESLFSSVVTLALVYALLILLMALRAPPRRRAS